jgi:DNA-binding Xre family transcriptional regulator
VKHILQTDFRLQAKSALLERRLSVTQLAQELGFARNTVSVAINHSTMHPTVKQRIAKHLAIAI